MEVPPPLSHIQWLAIWAISQISRSELSAHLKRTLLRPTCIPHVQKTTKLLTTIQHYCALSYSISNVSKHNLIILIYFYYSRFLRARSFSPVAAQKQFSASENWRKKHNVAQVYYTTKPEDLEYSRRFYPCWTGRRDKVLQKQFF